MPCQHLILGAVAGVKAFIKCQGLRALKTLRLPVTILTNSLFTLFLRSKSDSLQSPHREVRKTSSAIRLESQLHVLAKLDFVMVMVVVTIISTENKHRGRKGETSTGDGKDKQAHRREENFRKRKSISKNQESTYCDDDGLRRSSSPQGAP